MSAFGGQKQFWANFDILGAPVPTRFYRWGPNLVCYSTPRYMLTCQISYRSVYSVALWRRKTLFLSYFRLRHSVVSPVGSNLTKLSTGAQLPYPTVSKSFLYSNAFMSKSGTQTLTFKSMMDSQTKNSFLAAPAAGEIRAPQPQRTWHGDRGPLARSCSSKTFGGLTHSFAARGRWKFGNNQTMST